MYWFLYDSNGNIKENQINNVNEWSNLNEYAGALSASETNPTAQGAFLHPSQYTVQSGKLVHSNAPTQAEQLASAQQAQIAQIDAGYQATIDAGFQATIASTKYTFGWQVQDRLDLQMVQSAIDKQIETFPIDYADIHGNSVSIADQTALTTLDKTANSFAWAQTKQRRSLIAQIKQQTTVSAVQAITWTTASY